MMFYFRVTLSTLKMLKMDISQYYLGHLTKECRKPMIVEFHPEPSRSRIHIKLMLEVGGLSLYMSLVATQARAYPGFCSMKSSH